MNELNDIMKAYLDADDLEQVGGFEKVKKQPGKIGRQDTKRISKSERKKVKKKRKQERQQEMSMRDDWQFV